MSKRRLPILLAVFFIAQAVFASGLGAAFSTESSANARRQAIEEELKAKAAAEKQEKEAEKKLNKEADRELRRVNKKAVKLDTAAQKEEERLKKARAQAEAEWKKEQADAARREAKARGLAGKEERLRAAALEKEERRQEEARLKAERDWRKEQEKISKGTSKVISASAKGEKAKGAELRKEEEEQKKIKAQAERQWRIEQARQAKEEARELAKAQKAGRVKKAALEKAEKEQERARLKSEKERELAGEKSRQQRQAAIAKINQESRKQEVSQIKEMQEQEINKMKAESQWRLEQAKLAREEAEIEARIQNEMKIRKTTLARAEKLSRDMEQREKDKQEASLRQVKSQVHAQRAAEIKEEEKKFLLAKNASLRGEAEKPVSQEEAKVEKIEGLWHEAKRLYSQGMYDEAIRNFQKVIELEGNPRIKYTPMAKELIEKARDNKANKKKKELTEEIAVTEKEMLNQVLDRSLPPYIEPPPVLEKASFTPLVDPPLIRKKLKEKKITLDFDKVDLKSVISFLFQESGINFVTSQKVQELDPKVTVRFKDTSLDEVIKYITKSLGLIYRIDKDIVWIAHPEEIANETPETRVYFLSKGAGLFTEFSPMSSGSGETGLGGSSAQVNKILTLEDTLKEIIPWPSDSKMVYDKRINALIVRNTPQNLQTLEEMLYTLDVTPMQVLIEARFIEVDVTNLSELGLEWKLDANFPVKKNKITADSEQILAKDGGFNFANFLRATEGFNLTYKGLLTTPQYEAVLHLFAESKRIKTLSSPRITTLSNQMATIKVVDEWIYPTRYEYEVITVDQSGQGTGPFLTTYKNVPKDFLRRDVGILLKVIPAVGADKRTINLSLVPEVSEGVANGFSYTGDVTLPKFTSRNLSTTVVVNSGETVVLGGMIKENTTKTVTKIPFFGDIPWIGNFFKKTVDNMERKNLLIFVTAKVLTAAGTEVVVAENR